MEATLRSLRSEARQAQPGIAEVHIERYAVYRALTLGGDALPPIVADELRRFFAADAGEGARTGAALAADPQWEELRSWADAHGVEYGGLALARAGSAGRGLITTRDVAPGEVCLRVPERLILSPSSLNEGCAANPAVGEVVGAALSEAGGLHPDVAIALTLLLMPLLAPSGPWSSYARLLPATLPNALNWSDAQLERVRATAIPAQTTAARTALGEYWTLLSAPLGAAAPAEFSDEAAGFDRLLHCYSVVESRGMSLALGGEGEARATYVVPFADMANHSARGALGTPTIEEGPSGERQLVFRSLCALPAGAPVELYYGMLPCVQTLQYYGFVDPNELSDEGIELSLEPDDEDDEAEGGKGAAADGDVECLHERRQALLARLGLGLTHMLRLKEPLPAGLLGALRVCVMGASELGAYESALGGFSVPAHPSAGPLSRANERALCLLLRALLNALISNVSGGDARADGRAGDFLGGARAARADAAVGGAVEALVAHQRQVYGAGVRAVEALASAACVLPGGGVDVEALDEHAVLEAFLPRKVKRKR